VHRIKDVLYVDYATEECVMKKGMFLVLVLVCTSLFAGEESGEGMFGIDFGFSFGHFYTSPFPDAMGANIGLHYEPPITKELNLVVGARYNLLYWVETHNSTEENMLYHVPQAGIGVKFLFDVYNILPYMGIGFTFNLNAYDPNDAYGGRHNQPAGIRFAPGIYLDLGADIYTSDDFSVGFNARYDWVFDYIYDDTKIPNLFSFNLRINFLTFD